MKRAINAASVLIISALMALSCRSEAPARLHSPTPDRYSQESVLFRDVAEAAGCSFQHYCGATKQRYFPEIMGSGVALLDYNNDGALDILLVQGDLVNPHQKPEDVLFRRTSNQRDGCRLFRNDLAGTGKLHFTDVTEQAGLGHLDLGAGMGAAVGDYDNDGWPDVYLTGYRHCILLHNNGKGAFTDVTNAAAVADDGAWATSASFVDYDRDGRLDLVVVNYVDFAVDKNQKCTSRAGPPDYCGPGSYSGVSPRCYRNLGSGKFKDVTKASGLASGHGPGLGVSSADLDEDGWPDIFIANDQAANTLWLNQHNGAFKEAGLAAGCAYNGVGHPGANMGLAVGDIDNRGSEDILITHLESEGATLYRNDGLANFHDATADARLNNATFPFTGFGTEWFDYDNDGRLDLFIANGAVSTDEKQRGTAWPFQQSNQLFHNDGVGKGFTETTADAGPDMKLRGVGRGAAVGDLDNDGRLDIVVTNNNGPVRLLLNQSAARNHWLEVRLRGVKSNRMGLGAKVGILRSGQKPIWRRCHTDGSYCSASDARVHFGLGGDSTGLTVVVAWPGGARERWDKIGADKFVTLREGSGRRQ